MKALLKDNAEIDPGDVAEFLARAKAEEVSARLPGALVIGADQAILDKPKGSRRRPATLYLHSEEDASAPLGNRGRRRRYRRSAAQAYAHVVELPFVDSECRDPAYLRHP
jgi:hypothetical protein